MDFTEIVVEQHIDINEGTETPREIVKEIGNGNDYEYGKDGKQIRQDVRKKNHKEDTEINKEKEQRTIADERDKENLKNKEDIEMDAIEREIVREMREEDKRMEERRKEVGIEKAIAEVEKEAIDWEIMRGIREEETILNNRLKEVGIERIIDEIGQRTEIRQEPRNRRNDTYQCMEYVSKQIKQTNEEKPERIIIIGDSLMAHGREHLQTYENIYQQSQRATIKFKRGATLNEVIEEVKSIKLVEREG